MLYIVEKLYVSKYVKVLKPARFYTVTRPPSVEGLLEGFDSL